MSAKPQTLCDWGVTSACLDPNPEATHPVRAFLVTAPISASGWCEQDLLPVGGPVRDCR